jgi:site-specific DNA-methyltransferase (adenine-specific)
VVRELPIPSDLGGAGPTCALRVSGPDSAVRGELWHADAMTLLGRLPDGSVDLVIADPPYAIAKAEWDEFESLEAYFTWCDGWLAEVARVLAPHGSAYVCGFSEILADVKARSARRFAGCRWLVWYYRNKANLGHDWGRSHESILHLRKTGARVDVDAIRIPYNGHTTRYPARVQAVSSQYGGASARRDRWEPNPLGAKPRDVIELPVICNGMAEKTPHATQKPEALIEKLILASSAPGQLVVDPFVGSGTTAIVARRHGRSWLAGDSDPRFVGLTRERLAAAPPLPRKPRSSELHREPRAVTAGRRVRRPAEPVESPQGRLALEPPSAASAASAGPPAPAAVGRKRGRRPAGSFAKPALAARAVEAASADGLSSTAGTATRRRAKPRGAGPSGTKRGPARAGGKQPPR